MVFSYTNLAAGAIGLAISLYLLFREKLGRHRTFAPGPPRLPIVGNLLQVGTRNPQWETFAEWSRKYESDVLHIDGFGLTFLVLNSYQAVTDLLENRSALYSSRPTLPLLHELTGYDYLFALLPYGKRWRDARRMLTKHLNPSNVLTVKRTELRFLHTLLQNLLDSPQDFRDHIFEFSHSGGLSLVYGTNPPDLNAQVQAGTKVLFEYAPGVLNIGGFLSTLVPILSPLLELFPSTSSKEAVNGLKQTVHLMKEVTFDASYSAWASGSYGASMVTNILDEAQASSKPISNEDMKNLHEAASTSFLAYVATAPPTLVVFFLAMTLYPELQYAAQKELDHVLDRRLPSHSDLKSLPYVTAIFREVLRWMPMLPSGVPHLAIQDDSYRDFFIPKGTIVVPNQWAMTRDEEFYPDAESFKPQRFLRDGALNPNVLDPGEIVFGQGRRVCPGRELAGSTIQLAIASILAIFDIKKCLDRDGQEIKPPVPRCEHPLLSPPEFPCRIIPRSTRTAEIVQAIE